MTFASRHSTVPSQIIARLKTPFIYTGLFSAVLFSAYSNAGGFGTYDPRSQSMAGAAVAIGSVSMAAGHNPALLGLLNDDEDKSRNGRYYLPAAVGSLSKIAVDAVELIDEELDIAFDDALDTYNAMPNAANAAVVSQTATALEQALEDIANSDITFSAFVPVIAVAEPSNKGGGAFYLGSRIEGGGISVVPDDDIELFDRYVVALDNIAQGGDWRTQDCDVFNLAPDANGDIICSQYPSDPPALRDPSNDIESSARIRGLIINEVAVAMAWGIDWRNLRIAMGITPKAMQVKAFDEFRDISDDEVETSVSFKPHLMFNTDLGLAVEFDSGWRIAYAVKDLLTRRFNTLEGEEPLRLHTKQRLGLGFVQPDWQLGLDYDLQQAKPFTTEKTGQFLSLGGEYTLFNRLALRAGYRYDSANNLPAVTSLGLGTHWARTELNISYQSSQSERGLGLQLGFIF